MVVFIASRTYSCYLEGNYTGLNKMHASFFLLFSCYGLNIFTSTYIASLASQICDTVTVTRLLNLTLFVLELDKMSFWADPRQFCCSEKVATSFSACPFS